MRAGRLDETEFALLVDAFEETTPTPDDQYVEEILVQVLQDEFDTDLQDGSAEPVAVDVVRLWEETRVGADDLVVRFEAKADSLKGKRAVAQVVAANDEDEGEWEDEESGDDDDDAMDQDEAPQLVQAQPERRREEPEVDDDGFTMVKGKNKGHR